MGGYVKRLGLDTELVEREWGTGTPPEEVEKTLKADTEHKIKVVCVTQNETATGVTSHVEDIRKAMDAANHPALLFVDGVSSIASIDLEWTNGKLIVLSQVHKKVSCYLQEWQLCV